MSAVSVKSLGALVNLALRFVTKTATAPFAKRVTGSDIEARFFDEGVRSVPKEVRALTPNARKCIACGRCDFLVASGTPPSLLIPRLAREPMDSPLMRDAIGPLRDAAKDITAVCPEGVDVPALLLVVDKL